MMMKRFFALLALAVCVSSEASAFLSRGGAQKTVGKAAAKSKLVKPKKCVFFSLFAPEALAWRLPCVVHEHDMDLYAVLLPNTTRGSQIDTMMGERSLVSNHGNYLPL